MYFGLYDSLRPVLLGDKAGVAASFLLGWMVTITAGHGGSVFNHCTSDSEVVYIKELIKLKDAKNCQRSNYLSKSVSVC